MKLYTEEQIIASYNKGLMDAKNGIIDNNLLYGFLFIELPSDEEINNQIAEELTGFEESDGAYEYSGGFEYGAKWVIEQIKQQANEK